MKKLKFKSLKTKMMFLLGCSITVTCIGLSVNSYISSRNALITNVEYMLPEVANGTADTIREHLDGELQSVEIIAAREEIQDPNVPIQRKMDILSKEVERKGCVRITYIDKNGNGINTQGAKSDLKDREYFKTALLGKSNVSDPIVSVTDKSVIIAFAVPIRYNNEIVGVLSSVLDGNGLSKITNDIKVGKTGSTFMVNLDGTMIANENKDFVLNMENPIKDAENDPSFKSFADVVGHMTKGEKGTGRCDLGKDEHYVAYMPVDDTKWSVGVMISSEEVLAELNTLKINTILMSLGFMVIGIFLITFISNNISKGVKETSRHLDILAQGNLCEEVSKEYLESEDEVGNMTKSMKLMQDSLRQMIQNIKNNTSTINLQAENLSSVAEEISSVSENVTVAITEIAQGTSSQSEDLIKITDILNEFSDKLSKMVYDIHVIEENSKEIIIMATQSTSKMNTVNKSCDKIGLTSKEFYDKIMSLGKDINKIHDITNIINEIAGQTNLLALNASIEAARAGESGNGFAVVANEIKKLAEQSKSSATDINSLISNISRDADKIIEGSIEMDDELKQQGELIGDTISAFAGIINAVNEVIPKIELVKDSAVDIDNNKNTIVGRINKLSSISVEVSASSEEISASSEEMSAQTQEISAAAQVLNSKTTEMMEEVNKFQI